MEKLNLKEKNTVIFIGNGYDRAYSSKTGYNDFIESDIFEQLHKDNNNLVKRIKEMSKISKWVDLENALYYYSKEITNQYSEGHDDQAKLLEKEFYILKLCLYKYLQHHSNSSSQNKDLDKLQKEWIYNNSKLPVDIICFNYTPLVENKMFRLCLNNKCNIHKVHGDLDYNLANTRDSIVLGIDEEMKVEKKHDFLYKSKGKDLNINGIKNIIKNAEKYIFFGCSLGETDNWYFKEIFKSTKKSFDIYYYGQYEYENITSRIMDLSGNLITFKSENEVNFLDSNNLKFVLNDFYSNN